MDSFAEHEKERVKYVRTQLWGQICKCFAAVFFTLVWFDGDFIYFFVRLLTGI